VATGRVIVSVKPRSAVVEADGDEVAGENGRFEFDHPAGDVELRLSAPGYVGLAEVVRVPPGSAVRVNLVLRPKPVQVHVLGARRVAGRVTIEGDGFRSECGLPCVQRIPYAEQVKVTAVVDGAKGGPWVETRSVEPGQVARFVVPVEAAVKVPAARLRAVLVAKNQDGSPARIGLVDANVLTKPRGSRRARVEGVLSVTFRYEYDGKTGLRFTLASDPYSTVFLDGKGLGTTPVVRRLIKPGSHRISLREHNAVIHLRFDRF
jgi:hypothetical protein